MSALVEVSPPSSAHQCERACHWCRKGQLRQRDTLEGADDVVRAFGGEEAFVVAGAEIPVGTFVIFVAIKSPDAVYDNETTDPVVPKIADVVKAQVCPCVGAFETNVIVKDEH